MRFSALQRAEIAEIDARTTSLKVSQRVSVLFNEPKLLKLSHLARPARPLERFSALQRAEIAEIARRPSVVGGRHRFSALQRAEIAEICTSTQ